MNNLNYKTPLPVDVKSPKRKSRGPESIYVPAYMKEFMGVRSISYYRGQLNVLVARSHLSFFTPYKFWYERTLDIPEGFLMLHFLVPVYIRLVHDLFYYEAQDGKKAPHSQGISERNVEIVHQVFDEYVCE